MVGASIHRNALMDSNLGGDVSVGCVLILKQVLISLENDVIHFSGGKKIDITSLLERKKFDTNPFEHYIIIDWLLQCNTFRWLFSARVVLHVISISQQTILWRYAIHLWYSNGYPCSNLVLFYFMKFACQLPVRIWFHYIFICHPLRVWHEA